MHSIKINQGKSLSLPLRLATTAASLTLIYYSFKLFPSPFSLIFPVSFSLIGPFFWFAIKLLEIDPLRKQVFTGIWSMGLRFGKWVEFKQAEIAVEETKIKPTEFLLENRRVTVTREYRAFLVLENGSKIFMLSHPLQKRLQSKIQTLRHKLSL
ncbi:MAG: hypothetical protein AAF616_09845 [Bacteroidota bacterium]